MFKKSVGLWILLSALFTPVAWSEVTAGDDKVVKSNAVNNVAAAPPQLSADALLDNMKTAFKQLNYDLSYVEIERGRITPMRYSHGVIDDVSVGHLLSLNGNPREYLRRGDITSFFEAEQPGYSLSSTAIPGLLFNLMATELTLDDSLYQAIYVGGKSRVTGRLSQVVRVVPNDKYRFGYLIWIDVTTNLPLRIDMIKDSGEVVFQVMAISLYQFPDVTPWLEQLNSVKLPPVLSAVQTQALLPEPTKSEWKAAWMPDGFKQIVSNKHQIVGIGQIIDYMQFSDGLVDISIYVNTNAKAGSLSQGLGVSGQISLQSKITDDIEIVVVGEVPSMTAKKIADSVVRNLDN
ncbi:MAG: transcriptional regulator [Moritella sp.]|uniref:MucB/RseB C-terminal domain-containing protein n=1 Tax=unclassified Moritella TaxID=2637987 RepID=UPI00015693B9|nr:MULTISPECIES: MucB/RseB C-terminal domain-containing protein [unclassified Moritella]EDM66709.1 sigma-E factor regulatory protein RseB [Moritella sp. PE36]MBL1416584.1 MucB/RseB C-terminal domain-containing protein [Moritella sp.]PHR87771.1 MAG: transcriptional regulator [Moritella sp.]